jgi:hypothetical protein
MDSSFDFQRGLLSPRTQAAAGMTPSLEVAHMPVAELSKQVFLLASRGKKEEAAALARSIPLDFPWMWCRENEYSEKKTRALIAELRFALNGSPKGDPYFQALSRFLVHPLDFKPVLDWSLIETENLKICLTFAGSHTSLGAVLSDAAEIRAFGPQSYPLSSPDGFGIRKVLEHGNRWASPAASPVVWFETKAERVENKVVFDLAFFGLQPDSPLAFSFYVKAESAQIGAEKLKPKTLQRYQGISKPILFGGGLLLESLTPGKMEVIPLAGGGGYWDTEYLASFVIHPVNAKMSFSLVVLNKNS